MNQNRYHFIIIKEVRSRFFHSIRSTSDEKNDYHSIMHFFSGTLCLLTRVWSTSEGLQWILAGLPAARFLWLKKRGYGRGREGWPLLCDTGTAGARRQYQLYGSQYQLHGEKGSQGTVFDWRESFDLVQGGSHRWIWKCDHLYQGAVGYYPWFNDSIQGRDNLPFSVGKQVFVHKNVKLTPKFP